MSDETASLLPETDKVMQPDMEPVKKPPADEVEHDDPHHHESPLPAPSPDVYVNAALYMWGIGTFVAVIVSIIVLGGYFWTERGMDTAGNRIGQSSLLGKGLEELRATEAGRLNSYKKLEDGSYQVPIDRAKALVIRDLGSADK